VLKPVHLVKRPVVSTAAVHKVNSLVDAAFNEFNREYTKEVNKLARSGDHTKFDSQFAASVSRLRKSLAIDANRLPFGRTNLNPALQKRVDSLVSDLATKTTVASKDLITSDRFGANQDVSTFIHDEVANGDISVN
jgi:hypothetical protein